MCEDKGYEPAPFANLLPCLTRFDEKNLKQYNSAADLAAGAGGGASSMTRRANMDVDASLLIGDAPSVEQEAQAALKGHVDNTPIA